jgi:hypothetical protein
VDANQQQLITIRWETTETTKHRVTVDIEGLASLLGESVEVVRSYIAENPDLENIRYLGDRGLEDGLADVEDSSTETMYDGPYREVRDPRWARDAEVQEWRAERTTESVPVPDDHPVMVLGPDDPATDRVTCGTCGRSWDDAIATAWTPAPGGRCPFEAWH